MTDLSLYETDVLTWAERQVAELRRLAATAPTNAVDWGNVIEEIESVGRSEWKSVKSQLTNVLNHIIRGACDPGSLSQLAWGGEVFVFLTAIREDYRPSMRPMIDMDRIWRDAFRVANDNLQRHGISIPPGITAKCPFTLDEMINESFNYEHGTRQMLDAMATGRTSRPTNEETDR